MSCARPVVKSGDGRGRTPPLTLVSTAVAVWSFTISAQFCSAQPINRNPGGREAQSWEVFATRVQEYAMSMAENIDISTATKDRCPNLLIAEDIFRFFSYQSNILSYIAVGASRVKSLDMTLAVIVFDAIISDDSDFSWTAPGVYPPDAAEENYLISHGLIPWPPRHNPCRRPRILRMRATRRNGIVCAEGASIVIPELTTQAGPKACIILLVPNDRIPLVAALAEERLMDQLLGRRGFQSALEACAPVHVFKELPVDLTALASCFNSTTSVFGAAVVPSAIKLDALGRSDTLDMVYTRGMVGPHGKYVVFEFPVFVRKFEEGSNLRVSKIIFTLIALPAWPADE